MKTVRSKNRYQFEDEQEEKLRQLDRKILWFVFVIALLLAAIAIVKELKKEAYRKFPERHETTAE